MKQSEKVLCRTPTVGKKPTRIDAWKFGTVRQAILAVVPQSEPGILFTDLTKKVARKLSKADQAKVGSLMWYVTTVKLELEVRGELRRVKGVIQQRLVQG